MTKQIPLAERGKHRRPAQVEGDGPSGGESIRRITLWAVFGSLAIIAAKPLLDILGDEPGANSIDVGTIVTMVGAALMLLVLVTSGLTAENLPWSLFLIFTAIAVMIGLSVISYLALPSRADLLELFKIRRTVVFGPFVPPTIGVPREAMRLIASFAPLALIVVMIRYPKVITEKLLRYTALTIVGAGLVHCVIAWLQVAGIVRYSFYFNMPGIYVGRPSGGYYHPLSMGRLLVMGAVILYVGYEKLRLGAVKHYAIIGVMLATLVISTHRFSILGMAMVIALFEVRRLLVGRKERPVNRRTLIGAAAGFAALGLAAIVVMGNDLTTRVSAMFSVVGSWDIGSDRFLNGRGAIWIDTARAFGKASWDIWLFGFGYEPWDMHNDLIRIGVVWGAVGVILTVTMLVTLYRFTRRMISPQGRWGLAVCYLVLVFVGLTQKPISYPYSVWLFLFCHLVIISFHPISPGSPAKADRRWRRL